MHTDQWRAEEKQYSCPVVMRGSDTSGDLEIVAKCYGIEGHKALEIAQLIAAAPDLLAALKRLVEYCNNHSDYDAIGEADKAIAKAEGRSE